MNLVINFWKNEKESIIIKKLTLYDWDGGVPQEGDYFNLDSYNYKNRYNLPESVINKNWKVSKWRKWYKDSDNGNCLEIVLHIIE